MKATPKNKPKSSILANLHKIAPKFVIPFCSRGYHGAKVLEWTPAGVGNYCQSHTLSRNFK